jgi:hypothetical protein
MIRLILLAGGLMVLPACILAVKVEDNSLGEGGHNHNGGRPEVTDTGAADSGGPQDTDPAPVPALSVTVTADPATIAADSAALVLLTISGDIDATTLTGLLFDAPLTTGEWRALPDGTVIVDVGAPADAMGPLGLTVEGLAGRVHVASVLSVTGAEHDAGGGDEGEGGGGAGGDAGGGAGGDAGGGAGGDAGGGEAGGGGDSDCP